MKKGTSTLHETPLHLGIDIGSVSVNTVLLDSKKHVIFDNYTRTKGEPLKATVKVLSELLSTVPAKNILSCSITGTGGAFVARQLDAIFINEIIAQAKAVEQCHPEVRTIIEMGGEDAKLILVRQEDGDELAIHDFAMNTMCAAGTGSFLDQQAHRLGYSIEEFSSLALKSETPPRLAGRCSVFAKTDMIHLQQEATPDFDIIAGLCFAMARNLKSNIGKGKKFQPPVSFQGGVAANLGVRKAFESILKLSPGELIIPGHFFSMGAIGAALITIEHKESWKPFKGIERLKECLAGHTSEAKRLPPLSIEKRSKYGNQNRIDTTSMTSIDSRLDVYLGVDVGSISTNVVLIDTHKNLVAKAYLMTAGRPLDAVKQGLSIIGKQWANRVHVLGAATTGSGRYLTGDFIGADIVRNEITAQATAAADIDPEVDTIFEIGGQDSKYISLDNGVIVDFMMNKVCAAGTGSFLEEQAEKLGISIKKEFGALALSSKHPVRLGERCTVFMESDLVHHQQQGCEKKDLIAGLSYSIVENYLNRVVEDRRVGKRIFYQGATAQNQGIVAAFEKVTGKPITVPEDCDVTGAIGAALLAMKERDWKESTFKGFELSQSGYTIKSFECGHCPNRCEIRKVTVAGSKPFFYGSRCERYEVGEKKTRGDEIPDLFKEREQWLLETPFLETSRTGKRGTIGIPRTMFFLELMPFWVTFFESLGYTVVISEQTNKRLIGKGVERMVAETCFPIKVAHGHILDLIDKGIDTIFLPHIVDLKKQSPDFQFSYLCPYAQTLPYMVHSAINFKELGVHLIQPVLYFGRGYGSLLRGLKRLGDVLGIHSKEISRATEQAEAAQERFYLRIRHRGQEILSGLKPDEKAMIVVSRPYNGYDPGINLNLPKKLRDLDTLAIPMDFLPLDAIQSSLDVKSHYWKFGQKIMSAAELIRKDRRLFAIYITNFGCGPDSFIAHFFRNALKGKPYLEIEIDEHSADAGAITRLEAFLDSLKHYTPASESTAHVVPLGAKKTGTRKVFIPAMSDQAFSIAAAFKACGIESEVLPESDDESLRLGHKLTSGKECYPCILTTGDMAKRLNRPDFDPDRSAFFMPSGTGPCRFGQYHRFHRLVLNELGYPQVPIYAPTQSEVLYKELGMVDKDFARLVWQGVVATDFLEKALRKYRPYETTPGETDHIYQRGLKEVNTTIAKRGSLTQSLIRARTAFGSISTNGTPNKPVVGLVGEIYTRANRFANEDVVRKIESLGGEVWMPPIAEWLLYINFIAMDRSLKHRRLKTFLTTLWTDRIQKRDEHRLGAAFMGDKHYPKDPEILKIILNARPYLHYAFRGEAVLSVGKTIDFIQKGAAGILNIMPFTCMPGTIANALLKRCREEHDNIPFLNMAYDGQAQTNTMTRLEAFMYQVKRFHENRL
ncbi:MAG: CoA activase [Deltaproteobacteria bacterium]|nr:CoA activase [Deltaproteobacteria bacterium]